MKPSNKITPIFLMIFLLPVFSILAQDGEALFKSNCAACHKTNKQKLVGPGLEGVAERRSEAWLLKFIKNSQKFIQTGDADAVAVFEENNKTVMPPFEHLNDADIQSIINYLPSGAKPITSDAPVEAVASVTYTADDILQGKMLYVGTKRFTNKGQACISCHNVSNNEIIPGGLLAKDLTNVFARLGHEGITGLLGSPPFPAMATAYSNNKLTDTEILQLTAFLNNVDAVSATQKITSGNEILLGGGFAGVIVLLIFIGFTWGKRKKESVKRDIFKRQLRGNDSKVY
jgi:mono/diheme cytochrome c family protein